MSKPVISMIIAMDRNRLIGSNNQLPWHLPADLAYFKKVTMGHPILMGRKTHDSIGKPLPGRTNIVITQNPSYEAPGCEVVHSVDEAMQLFKDDEVFIIGGSEIFKLFLPLTDKLYITHIDEAFEGDTYLPEIEERDWKVTRNEQGITDEKNPYTFYFTVYERHR